MSAHNLGATFVNSQVFLRNLNTSHTQLESQIGTSFPATALEPSLDAAGDRLAFVAYGSPLDSGSSYQVLVHDLRSNAFTLASRANGAGGAQSNGDSESGALDPTGDCIAFQSLSTNLADGFGSPDFTAVHLRVLRGQCPLVPRLSALMIKPGKVHLRGRHRGATISFALNVASAVTLRFDQLRSGRRKGHRCAIARKHGRRCTVVQRRGRTTVNAVQGTNRVRFSGKVGRRRLGPGRYRLTATPQGGKSRSLTFTILR